MLKKLILLYGEQKGIEVEKKLEKIIEEAKSKIVCENRSMWDEKDVFLITYADSFYEIDSGRALPIESGSLARMTPKPSLKTLAKFLDVHLRSGISGVHILPFYPYSSDRGFSVTDFYQVNKEFGSWSDIEEIGKKYRLMADLVLNHVSVQHEWFQKFLSGEDKYWNYFIHFAPDEIPHEQLKKVFRPRNSPLLTPFQTARGERRVWTTFGVEGSTDQVDLNYQNPEVLVEIIKLLLFFLEKNVRVFRLDSIPYVWKELGTDCKNLPQSHTIVSILRSILDQVCPESLIVSQASTSFAENIKYFYSQDKESQLIYNFALPPLVLDAFINQKNNHLNRLAEKMKKSDNDCSFLNILALHDGIGVNAAKDFLSEAELAKLYAKIEENGGKLSYRSLPDGKSKVIEVNSTWWSALAESDSALANNPHSLDLQLKKFITSYAIAFSLAGIPAVYYLSLFGKENDFNLYRKTKIKRDLNRTNLDLKELEVKLNDKNNKDSKVFAATTDLIKKRKQFPAFHPNSKQELINLDERVFSLLRGKGTAKVLALHNLSNQTIKINYQSNVYELEPYGYSWNKLS